MTLLLVVAVANPLAAPVRHAPARGSAELTYQFDGTNLVLLVGGVLATVVGVLGAAAHGRPEGRLALRAT